MSRLRHYFSSQPPEHVIERGRSTLIAPKSGHPPMTMTPTYARALTELLESLRHYESHHGEIPYAAEEAPAEKVQNYERAHG